MDCLLSSFSGFSESGDSGEIGVFKNRLILCGAVLDASSNKTLREACLCYTPLSLQFC